MHYCLDTKLVGPIWGLEFVLPYDELPRKQGGIFAVLSVQPAVIRSIVVSEAGYIWTSARLGSVGFRIIFIYLTVVFAWSMIMMGEHCFQYYNTLGIFSDLDFKE